MAQKKVDLIRSQPFFVPYYNIIFDEGIAELEYHGIPKFCTDWIFNSR